MSKTKRKNGWTTAEVATLKRCVKNAETKTQGFKDAAKELGRSAATCSTKWYEMEKAPHFKLVVKKAAEPSRGGIHIFKVDSDWKPTKVYSSELDSFLSAVIDTTGALKPGQSFPIPYTELKNRYGWKEETATNSIRHLVKKEMDSEVYGRIKIHEVRDTNKRLTQVRIRRVPEA
jgi:hypothetical protein